MQIIRPAIFCAALGLALAPSTLAANAAQVAAPAATRQVGTIKAIGGSGITLATDAAGDIKVTVQDGARVIRVAPGQKLKDGTAISTQELAAGDRILVVGTATGPATFTATTVVVMKQEDIAAKQQRERQDWDKRGVAGVVTAVNPAGSAITLSTGGFGTNKALTVKTSPSTIIRRYAPNSVKFDDAVKATLEQIKPGDQLRARGQRSGDAAELAAEEIVAGTFRNVAGLITAIDPATQTITINDLATKKPVVARLTADSQMHQLPQMVAMGLAMRLKGGSPQGANGAAAPGGGTGRPAGPPPQGAPQSGGTNGGPRRGTADFQQLLAHMPTLTVADLKKGDAVIMVTTSPAAPEAATAVTLLTGVEPILTASPNDNRAAMLLSPWNLGGGQTEGGVQ